MKKHDEGYVLPLVLVVMIVMCLIATSLMSFSLQNLKSQQASIDRMVEKYEAEGAVEIVVAKLEGTSLGSESLENYISKVKELAESAISSGSVTYELQEKGSNNLYSLEITACSFTESGSKHIEVTVSCTVEFAVDEGSITNVVYRSYEISNTGGGSDETE